MPLPDPDPFMASYDGQVSPALAVEATGPDVTADQVQAAIAAAQAVFDAADSDPVLTDHFARDEPPDPAARALWDRAQQAATAAALAVRPHPPDPVRLAID